MVKCHYCGNLMPRSDAIEVWPVSRPEDRFYVHRPDQTAVCFRRSVGSDTQHAIGKPE